MIIPKEQVEEPCPAPDEVPLRREHLVDALVGLDQDAMDEDADVRGDLYVCLGPSRCATQAPPCKWCLKLGAHAGLGDLDTLVAIHRTGH